MSISREQALDCFASDDLIGIGMEADAVRRRLHPDGVVSYLLDGKIVCADPGVDEIFERIASSVEFGGTGVVLENVSPLEIEGLESLFGGIKLRFPQLSVHGLSSSEIHAVAKHAGLSLREALLRLRDAGLDSIAGGDTGIGEEDWPEVHRAAHRIGMRTAATMVFGAGETVEQRVRHLETIRAIQAETGGFTAFVPIAFQSKSQRPGWEEATAVEYLKTLAISRMVLDNIENVQADWTSQGLKVLQMGLRFGGNDVGSAKLAARQAGTEEELRRIIRDAGFKPVQRDTLYRTMFLN